MDRETRSSILPVRTRYRLGSVAERGPPKPDVDCSIQSAGANVFFPLAGTQCATVVLWHEMRRSCETFGSSGIRGRRTFVECRQFLIANVER